jgi:ABC-type branched-subunit amino acid transport system substrate-binding protein
MTSVRTAAAAALIACAACKQHAPKTTTVVLGQVVDRTGSIATPSWTDSIRLAVGTGNQALRQAGHGDLRFELAEANSGNSPAMARDGALQVVRKDGAKAIVTDSSQDDIAIASLAYDGDPSHELSVPVVCMACTSPAIDDPGATDPDPVKQAALRNSRGWNFRTTLSDAYQARVLAQLLTSGPAKGDSNGDGHLKLGIYASDDPYGHGFAQSLTADVRQLSPGASVEQIFHDMKAVPAEYPWAADVARLTDKRNETTGKADGVPDAVVVISFPKFEINFTRAWLDAGSGVRLVHTHNFRATRVLEVLAAAVEGQEGTSPAGLGDGASARAFSEDLKALTGQPPAFRDAAAYDAVMSLMLATVHAQKRNRLADASQVTGAMIRDSMRAINDPAGEPVDAGVTGFARAVSLIHEGRAINYQGASGPCDFDAHGDVVAQLARFHVHAGQFVDAEKYDCARDPECPPLRQLGSK